jgi:hypothetical protein
MNSLLGTVCDEKFVGNSLLGMVCWELYVGDCLLKLLVRNYFWFMVSWEPYAENPPLGTISLKLTVDNYLFGNFPFGNFCWELSGLKQLQ